MLDLVQEGFSVQRQCSYNRSHQELRKYLELTEDGYPSKD